MEIWRLLISPPDCGARNLATDQAIAEQVSYGASLPTLRFYSWNRPTLSLGYAQPISLVDSRLASRLKIPIVRRSTGGQAILHDDELTYSIALPRIHALTKKGIMASYQIFNNDPTGSMIKLILMSFPDCMIYFFIAQFFRKEKKKNGKSNR